MEQDNILKLDPLIHAPTRLAILSILITAAEANFKFLKETIGTTDGNLSSHLNKLEENKYIKIKKSFVGKRPNTVCTLTEKGRNAFTNYLLQMETIVKEQKKNI